MKTGEEFCREAANGAANFLDKKVEEAGADGVVVAMSGGVDSSLVASLAAKGLGPGNVTGLGLPQAGVTSERDLRDARQHAEELGVEWCAAEISPVIEKLEEAGRELAEPTKNGSINLAPRARMALTYYVANCRNLLVAGTGNRSELLLGYFTKHGDGAADLLPIGDLYKTEVYALADLLDVPRAVLDKEPSAGLYPGQTDEEELGHSYAAIDPVLEELVDRGRTVEEVAAKTELSPEEVEAVKRRVESSAHKRSPPPKPGILERKNR